MDAKSDAPRSQTTVTKARGDATEFSAMNSEGRAGDDGPVPQLQE